MRRRSHTGLLQRLPQIQDRSAPHDLIYSEKVEAAVLAEKDQTIEELRETVEIMELKIKKLEQLVRLKDSKIQTLTNKLAQSGIQA